MSYDPIAREPWRRQRQLDREQYLHWLKTQAEQRWDVGIERYDAEQTGFKGLPHEHGPDEVFDGLFYWWYDRRRIGFLEGIIQRYYKEHLEAARNAGGSRSELCACSACEDARAALGAYSRSRAGAEEEQRYAYIGKALCGCILAASMDGYNRDNVAAHVADMVKSGLKVERVPATEDTPVRLCRAFHTPYVGCPHPGKCNAETEEE